MIKRILKKEFGKNKAINITVFLFILLSALLISGATSTIYTLVGSIDNFFEKSRTPDFTQSHTGTVNRQLLADFAEGSDLVKEYQANEMITIDGATLYIGNENESESASAMDVSFVTQSEKFDYILDKDNEPVQVKAGEIAVPTYYSDNRDVAVGNSIWVRTGNFEKQFTISEFARDAQMNPSLVNSKRFVISPADFAQMQKHIPDQETLIEFLLSDTSKFSEFNNQYMDSGLPADGFTIDQTILKLFNALSDVMVAAIIIFISVLLITIALLCLRFTLLSTIEEEYREIGVMKAIGMELKDIRRLYMVKYTIISLAACILGYVMSLFVSGLLTQKITLYMGAKPASPVDYIIPILGALLIFGTVLLSCRIILRKFKKISSVEAIRSGRKADSGKAHTRIKLSKTKLTNMNILLGMRDVIVRFKSYILLFFVFIICTFIMILPMNFMTTMNAPDFLSYMGAAKCHIRIDMQNTNDIEARYEKMIGSLEKDEDIQKMACMVTCNYKVLGEEGLYENLSVESGDFNKFPINYVEGSAPEDNSQISLSYSKATDLAKVPGDSITMIYKGKEKEMQICGIYQDITNGGKTAKVALPHDPESVLRYTTYVDFKEGVDKEEKISSYTEEMTSAKVTDTADYMSQTLGGTIDRLEEITVLASTIAVFIALLITALFFNMLITKDAGDMAILNSLGYSFRDIRNQYMTRATVTGIIGVLLGLIVTMTLGAGLVDFAGSFMGIAEFNFIINPLLVYALAPVLLLAAVIITMMVVTRRVNSKYSIREIVE